MCVSLVVLILTAALLLMRCGDVETNPGPMNGERVGCLLTTKYPSARMRRVILLCLCVCVTVSDTTLQASVVKGTQKFRHKRSVNDTLQCFDSWILLTMLGSRGMAKFVSQEAYNRLYTLPIIR